MPLRTPGHYPIHAILTALLLLPAPTGCGGRRDLTHTPAVQQSGVIGQHLRTTARLVLVKHKESGAYLLVTDDYPAYLRGPYVGAVPAGAHLTVTKVQEITNLVAFMVFPVTHTWTGTFATIDTGAHACKQVLVRGEFAYREFIATLASPLLAPLAPE